MAKINPTTGQKEYTSADTLPAPGSPEFNTEQQKAGSLVDRYKNTNVTGGPSKFGNDTTRINEPGTGDSSIVFSEDPTRAKYRADAQGTIDAIRGTFDRYISDDTEAKRNLESKAYLSALAGGRAGSPSGASEEFKAGQKGEEQVKKDTAARDEAINNILSGADTRASQEFEKKRQEYLAGQKDKNLAEEKLNNNIKATAEGDIKAYAGAYSYDDWAAKVGPARVQQYMKETGRDEASLRALFIQHKPEGTKVFEKQVGDNYVIGYKDPITGKTSIETIALPKDGGDWKFQIIDKKPYFVDAKRGIVREASGFSGGGSSPAPIKGAPEGFTADDIEKGRSLFKQYGSDGYADPGLYVDAYLKWINHGGTADAFLKTYSPEEFVDPQKLDSFPTFLRPKAVKKTPAPAGSSPAPTPTGSGRTY